MVYCWSLIVAVVDSLISAVISWKVISVLLGFGDGISSVDRDICDSLG